jgi:hypothetical protein
MRTVTVTTLIPASWRAGLRATARLITRHGRPGTAEAVARAPMRPVIVPASLDDLHGPSAGTVELPVRLYWSAGSRRFDVSDPDQAAALYDAVLDAASCPGDLSDYLNPGLLESTWPVLSMSRVKRDAWEARFPQLRRQRLAAAA